MPAKKPSSAAPLDIASPQPNAFGEAPISAGENRDAYDGDDALIEEAFPDMSELETEQPGNLSASEPRRQRKPPTRGTRSDDAGESASSGSVSSTLGAGTAREADSEFDLDAAFAPVNLAEQPASLDQISPVAEAEAATGISEAFTPTSPTQPQTVPETGEPVRTEGRSPESLRHMAKCARGLLRPQGARSRSVKSAPRERAANRSIATALAASAVDPHFSEFEEILRRLVDRIVKLLQAEMCVFMLHDDAKRDLQAVSPARGIAENLLPRLTVSTRGRGLTADVFRSGHSLLLSAESLPYDTRAIADRLPTVFGVRNALSAPLFIERRIEGAETGGEIISRDIIGVVHVFNKLPAESGNDFTPEDASLLEAMSRSAASIFSSARAFREVVTEKQELIQTLDSLYVGLMMVGLDGRIIQINPAARTVLGVDDDEPVVGLRYESVTRNESLSDVLDKALATLDPVETTGEVSVRRSAVEERIYQAHCAPVKNQDSTQVVGLLVLLSDITEIRGVDRMKTAFISTVSHELRTPLTSIKGFIATLLDDTEGFYTKEDQQEFYQIIDTECDRLTRLIDDLLNVSRIEQGQAMQLNLQAVDVRAVAATVLAAQRAYTSPDRHQLSVHFDDDFPAAIEADPDKIGQILTNLVSNAIKYSPRGGQVDIIGALSENTPHSVTLTVRDQGLGIPREHQKKIFERFHRVDNRDNREIGGTGIGLFLVKSLAEAHHGMVRVESEYGRGSAFIVTLPITQPVEQAAPEAV